MADSSFALPQGATATKAALGLDTTDTPQFARLGLGTSAHASRPLLVSGDVSGGVATINRNNSTTNAVVGTMIIKGTSTGNMADGFGTAFQFYIQDDAGVENYIADVRAIRDGGDTTGKLVLSTTNAGVTSTALTLKPDLSAEFSGALKPASNDGAAIGTTALQFSDLFLAEGGVINWDNGDFTITQANNDLTLAGGTLVVPAAGTSDPGLQLQVGTLQTTPEVGSLELDANCLYATTDAGNRGYVEVNHFIRANATRTFTSNTSQQAIFDSPANGTLTLETGTYFFEGLIAMTSMSGTSGNGKFSLIGAGTATLGDILWQAYGNDNAAETTGAAIGGSWHVIATQTGINIVTAGTGTALCFSVKGTFTVTVAGTIIPSFAQTTAAAAVVSIGSYFKCNRVGDTSVVSVGQWS